MVLVVLAVVFGVVVVVLSCSFLLLMMMMMMIVVLLFLLVRAAAHMAALRGNHKLCRQTVVSCTPHMRFGEHAVTLHDANDTSRTVDCRPRATSCF